MPKNQGRTGAGEPTRGAAPEDRSRTGEPRAPFPSWTDEDAYWRDHYGTRPYASADRGYEHYRPAYRYGYDAAQRYRGRSWNEVESELVRDWETQRERSSSAWEEMKEAIRDAWRRLS